MASMDLGKLLNEIIPAQRPKEDHVIPEGRKPDALVLITIEHICENCGARYRAPSKYLMLQYDRKLTKHDLFDPRLPRKELVHEEKVLACEGCFCGTPHEWGKLPS